MLSHLWSSDKDRELSDLKRNHRLAVSALAKAEQQCDHAEAQKAKAEHKSAVLEQKNGTLEQELQASKVELLACKDDLYRLQPTSHVPDSKIAGQYNDLVEGICTWIDAEISRYSDEWHKEHPDTPPTLFHHSGNRWVGSLLTSYPETAGEHLVRVFIQRRLYKALLNDEIYLFGLGKDSAIFQLVEKEMEQLQPPRGKQKDTTSLNNVLMVVADAKTIRAWRSETLNSIAKSAMYSEELAKHRSELAGDLFEYIESFFPIVKGNHTSGRLFYEKIIKPAINLAMAMQMSPTPYTLKPRMTGSYISQRCFIARDGLANMKVIDAETGKTLKGDSPVVEDEYGRIGEQLALLTPSLWRCVPGEKPVRLTQKVLLVGLYYPLGRRRASTAQPSEHPASDTEDLLA
jgi:hypothetical protein